MATTSDELAEFNRMLKKQDDDARTDRYFQDLNEEMANTIRDFRYGRAQAEDVQRFLPGHSEWDVHRRFGDTDEGTNLTFPSAPPSFKRLEEFETPPGEINEFGPDGRYRREDELQAKDGGLADKKTQREMANTQFDQFFVESGQKYGVDPAILKAIASVESSFRPNVRGPRTRHGQAQGLMQFIPATAKAYGLDDPFDPEKSIDAAARLMRDNMKMFKGDVGKALEAYNGGPRLVGKSRQTAEYREKVLQRSQYAGFGASPTQVAQQPAPKTPTSARPSPPARVGGERVGLSALSTLPMNYQAAIALQYLTDTDPEGNPEEQAEQALRDLEKAETQEAPSGPTLAQAMASQEMPSPFEPLRRRRQDRRQRPIPSMAGIAGFKKGGEARSDDYEDLATQMTFGTLPEFAKDSKAVKEGLKESGRDILRGIKLFPADLIGAPVDLINLGLTPFGLGSDKPFMGSDYLIDKGVKAGIYEKPSGSGVETLTRMAGLPASTIRGAMRAMQKGEETLGKGIDLVKGKFPETAPEGAIKPPTPGASFSFMPTQEMPFVGRIDKHVANLPYPVQKEAFINSLKGKFKGYEVDRVQEALEGIPANQKLTSSDLLNALQQNQFYNPSNYKVEIIPRGVIPAPEIWGGVDIKFRPTHVYPADPNKYQIGVIHLRHNRPEVAQLEDLDKKINFGYKYPRIDLSPLEPMPHSAYYRDADELSNAHKAMQNWQEELAKIPGVNKEQVEKVGAAVGNFPAKAEEAFNFAAISRALANDPLTMTAQDAFVGKYTSASLREARKKADETFGKDQRNQPEVFREVSIAALKQLEDYGFDIPLMLNATNIKNRRGEIDMTGWATSNHNARDLGLTYDSDKIKALAKDLVQVGYKPLPDGRRVRNLMDSEDYKDIFPKKYGWEKSLRELENKNPQAFKDLTELVGHLASNHKAILLASHPDIAAKMAGIDNQQVINAFRTTALEMGYPQSFPTELIIPGQEVKAALGNIQESLADRIKNARELDFQKLSAHSSLKPPKDAISFSRFIAVYDETNPVNFSSPSSRASARQGIHITELQSDRRKLAEHLGTPKENPQTDIPKIAKLEEKFAAAEARRDEYLKDFRKNKPQFASDPKEDLIKLLKFTDPDFAKLEEKVTSANTLLQHVKARPSLVGKNAPYQSDYKLPIYGVQESFPGMGTRGEDLQILMMKAAVDGAVRQGVQFVTFPGPESLQPQLYELVEKNMRSLVKELGPPFRVEEVTLRSFDPKDPGNLSTALVKKPAIVWDKAKEAEKTIKKGIPFAKGGLVSMQQIHNWV